MYQLRQNIARLLDSACGDPSLAMALYDWNFQTSAVFLEALGYAEILVRNTIDAQFQPLIHGEPARHSWLLDPLTMSPRSLEIVTDAVIRIERARKYPTRARLVSNLSFGFWRALFNKRYQQLWISSLHAGFPNGTGDRSQVACLLARLNSFRNRIAHHEPIVNAAIQQRHDDLLSLVRLIDLQAAAWLAARSEVPAVLARRPG